VCQKVNFHLIFSADANVKGSGASKGNIKKSVSSTVMVFFSSLSSVRSNQEITMEGKKIKL
jgi:hypothetical protein